jgi:hypothetical protein
VLISPACLIGFDRMKGLSAPKSTSEHNGVGRKRLARRQ